jgi:3-oxoacyl-[acyl-carrier-protein] synthase-3
VFVQEAFIQSVGVHLPPPESAARAVEDGRYRAQDHEANGITAVLVSPDQAAPQMAVHAARSALSKAQVTAADIRLVLHASLYHQGQDFWTPANYIQHEVLGHGNGLALQVGQASNGGLAALHTAVVHLQGDPDCRAALVTAADRYCHPGFDRWNSDIAVVYADGAAAAVVARGGGAFRIRSVHSSSSPDLEAVCRDGFTTTPHASGSPLDIRSRKAAYLARTGLPQLMTRVATETAANAAAALADAKVEMADIRWTLLPHLGFDSLEWEFLEPLGIGVDQTLWSWGKTIGHLGAGDHFAALDHLLSTRQCSSGDLLLLAGVGLGFNWTSVVLEVC